MYIYIFSISQYNLPFSLNKKEIQRNSQVLLGPLIAKMQGMLIQWPHVYVYIYYISWTCNPPLILLLSSLHQLFPLSSRVLCIISRSFCNSQASPLNFLPGIDIQASRSKPIFLPCISISSSMRIMDIVERFLTDDRKAKRIG